MQLHCADKLTDNTSCFKNLTPPTISTTRLNHLSQNPHVEMMSSQFPAINSTINKPLRPLPSTIS